jgi:RNA polymerase sigma-70 factor (ECF subfamily)
MLPNEITMPMTKSHCLRQFLSFQDDFMGYLYLLTGNRDACLEVLQDAAVAILEYEKLDEIDNLRAWSREVVRRQALHYLRRESTHRKYCRTLSPELVEAISNAFVQCNKNLVEAEFFDECFEKLSKAQRRIVDLRYGSGSSFEQIAAAIDSTAAAIQRSLSRTREQLRECVQRKLKVHSS